MNVADSEIVHSILQTAGLVKCEDLESADLILANTCAIRENAEDKVWHRIDFFNSLKNKNRQTKKAPKGKEVSVIALAITIR
jgi:tRNA-2-methylthio-N6-dimethylallyladenosine synthase